MVVRAVTVTEFPSAATEPGDIDLSSLVPQDVPPSEFPTPNAKAGRVKKPFSIPGFKPRVKQEKAPRQRKALPRKSKGQFIEPLTQMYGGIGMMLMPFDPVCSQAIIAAAPECARTLDELAYQNDAVRRTLIALTQTSATTAVLIAHMPIIMAVFMHHAPGTTKDKMVGIFAGAQQTASAQTEAPDEHIDNHSNEWVPNSE